MFTDLEFDKVCRELEHPYLPESEGWEFFVESHDVTIYRQYNKVSGLYQYKIFGELKDVNPDVCAQVYMDTEYRKIWDTYVNDLREIEEGINKGIYWQINFPFMMSNRDYVYMRELREVDMDSKHIYCVLAKSANFNCCPEIPGVIRVDDYFQSSALTSNGAGGTKAFMHYYDNPKGMIPTWLINWGAKTGVPQFLTQMQSACRGYPDYLRTKQQS
ncbi:phosphatidylcholine transfer protein-like [Lingula anatina]|uniref:Phosphatidylcholine transfer protein n=1 Tax=Lingula anatina TaxID=7574 RepID=A0A1S3HYW4_LINAN|nr:phosphatidylcholine transfer protein-like [Lingula anatina]|eukprot:XP_013390274.1 phosphatidylcholine transfer protein-like [Lingula anatina]